MSNQFVDYSFIADWNDRPRSTSGSPVDYVRRAMAVWPGLDRARLRRARNDPMRIGRVVAHSTSAPLETILVLLQDED
jgi:hypothetical protein